MAHAQGAAEWTDTPHVEASEGDVDLLGRYRREVHRASPLNVTDEEALVGDIVRQRAVLVSLLRRHPELVARALGPAAKGTVHPARSFREREALRILTRARREASQGKGGLAAFADRLQKEIGRYRVFRDQMTAANLRLVVALARRYRHPTLSQLDLIQEGTLGLFRAIERYEPERGTKFSTYATWWIWQQLSRAADNVGSIIRTPVHWNQFRRKVYRTAGHHDTMPTAHAVRRLAGEEGLSTDYARAMEHGVPCVSLDTPAGLNDDSSLGDCAAIDVDSDPALLSETEEIRGRIRTLLTALPVRDRDILRLRFGFSSDGPLTLAEIGERYGVSRERIRQIESQALKRMRQLCQTAGVQPH